MASDFQRRHHIKLADALARSHIMHRTYLKKEGKLDKQVEAHLDKTCSFVCLSLVKMLKDDNPAFQWKKFRNEYIRLLKVYENEV